MNTISTASAVTRPAPGGHPPRIDDRKLMEAGLAAAKPEGAPAVQSASRITSMAEAIAGGKKPQPSPPPPPPPGTNRADSGRLDDLASLLNMSTSDLLETLLDGTSLAELAESNGTTLDALRAVVEPGSVFDAAL